ncbi:MAG: XdhC family protein [Pyrinomonadaceae bacterium MAG19_C2-C3]|nr:XdhC family protein [Pyrinomonadaceae bacterium MAG19_C2-C3]
MNEACAVVEAYKCAAHDGKQAALATVVRVEGSAYRRAGARMLMTDDGRMTGSLSGGCLEGDVYERARRVMRTGEAIVVRYDTGASEDIVWGLGLGCNGVVHVLIEPLKMDAMPAHLELLQSSISHQQACVIATVFGVDKPSNIAPGSRLMINGDGENSIVEFADDDLTRAVLSDARAAISTNESSIKLYNSSNNLIEVFIEVVEPPVSVVVFGANSDVVPIVELADMLGWQITVVDTQAREASRERFAKAHRVLLCRPENVATDVPLTPRNAAIVMTHNFTHDAELFKTLIHSPAPYVGMLGPKRRTERIIAEAMAEGLTISDVESSRLHTPIGLDLGAETPEEIALSIIAEIRAVVSNHEGGFLKHRRAPIHHTAQTRREQTRMNERISAAQATVSS